MSILARQQSRRRMALLSSRCRNSRFRAVGVIRTRWSSSLPQSAFRWRSQTAFGLTRAYDLRGVPCQRMLAFRPQHSALDQGCGSLGMCPFGMGAAIPFDPS